MIDLSSYKVIHGDKVLNAIALEMVDYGEDFVLKREAKVTIKPKHLGVLAINSDGNIVLIHDEAWRFQFIPARNGERSRQ